MLVNGRAKGARRSTYALASQAEKPTFRGRGLGPRHPWV